MQISKAASYAIVAMGYLAQQSNGGLVPALQIADNKQIPKAFLHKILRRLENSGFIKSKKGPKGGYKLTRPADSISILEIVETIQGQMFFNGCLLGRDDCNDEASCNLHPIWEKEQHQFKTTLESTMLDIL